MNQELTEIDDRITNYERVELKEFVKLAYDDYTSYIRMFPDRENAEIRLYTRLKHDDGSDRWIRTTLEGVRMRFFRNVIPDKIHFHGSDAQNLITFLTALKWERTDMRIEFRYDPENDSPMLEKAGLHSELIWLKYKTESGNSNVFSMNDTYEKDIQRNAHLIKQN